MSLSLDLEDPITVDGYGFEEHLVSQDYKSALTNPDISDECDYSSDENSEDISEVHMGKDHIMRMI